jgi:hypothetical protein
MDIVHISSFYVIVDQRHTMARKQAETCLNALNRIKGIS